MAFEALNYSRICCLTILLWACGLRLNVEEGKAEINEDTDL